MKILVCIKQVPGTNKVEVDEQTGALKRDGVDSKLNPYDLYAIETALRIREKTGGSVTALTMGPLQAEAVIREAYMMGVDEGFLISDKKFTGADVLATSYTLFMGIKTIGEFDIVVCGKQTTDGDTGQVGPALAEYLGIPHISWVKGIKEVDHNGVVVEQDMTESSMIVRMQWPCLITVDKDIIQPRLPSYRKKLATKNKVVNILTLKDFVDQNANNYGLLGSATKVESIFPPQANKDQIILEGSGEQLTKQLYAILEKERALR